MKIQLPPEVGSLIAALRRVQQERISIIAVQRDPFLHDAFRLKLIEVAPGTRLTMAWSVKGQTLIYLSMINSAHILGTAALKAYPEIQALFRQEMIFQEEDTLTLTKLGAYTLLAWSGVIEDENGYMKLHPELLSRLQSLPDGVSKTLGIILSKKGQRLKVPQGKALHPGVVKLIREGLLEFQKQNLFLTTAGKIRAAQTLGLYGLTSQTSVQEKGYEN